MNRSCKAIERRESAKERRTIAKQAQEETQLHICATERCRPLCANVVAQYRRSIEPPETDIVWSLNEPTRTPFSIYNIPYNRPSDYSQFDAPLHV